jgi:serine/threonine-protein kinase HipA
MTEKMVPDVTVLRVLLHGQSVGTLTRLPSDRNLFAFDQAYIDNPKRPTLSLSFKDAFGGLITDINPTQTRLPPFFSNLLPEGALREYLATRANVNAVREFFLMWVLGQDLPGALRIVPTGGESTLPPDNVNSENHSRGSREDGVLRFSLAGVQLKFSAVNEATGGLTIRSDGEGGSWIVKLPSARFAALPENEFAMMELARRVGIQVPETKLAPLRQIAGLPRETQSLGDTAFAIRRFDRLPNGSPVHIEDFAQVFDVYPEAKYGKASYRNIATVVSIETGEAGIAELIRRLVFNTLIGNADMHLKNWSLIYPDGVTAQLAPAYDFVSTVAYIPDKNMALTLARSKAFASVNREQFARFAGKAGLSQKLTARTVEETVITFARVWRDADLETLDRRVRNAIDVHLKSVPLWTEIAGK